MCDKYGDMLTVDEFAKMLSIGKNTAYKLLNSGNVKCFRINRKWKIPKENVIEYIDNQISILR